MMSKVARARPRHVMSQSNGAASSVRTAPLPRRDAHRDGAALPTAHARTTVLRYLFPSYGIRQHHSRVVRIQLDVLSPNCRKFYMVDSSECVVEFLYFWMWRSSILSDSNRVDCLRLPLLVRLLETPQSTLPFEAG